MTGLDVEVPGLHFSYVYSVCCQFSTFTVSLKVIPTLVLAHFGPYHTHFGPKKWVQSGQGPTPKWV